MTSRQANIVYSEATGQNETLEAMARALYKSWCVEFDPVRAKANGQDSSLPEPSLPSETPHYPSSSLAICG